jgi:hypothetical protein
VAATLPPPPPRSRSQPAEQSKCACGAAGRCYAIFGGL